MLTARLNFGGALVVLLAVILVGGNLAVQSTLKDVLAVLGAWAGALKERWQVGWAQRRKRRHEASAHQRVVRQLEDSRPERRPVGAAPARLDLSRSGSVPTGDVADRGEAARSSPLAGDREEGRGALRGAAGDPGGRGPRRIPPAAAGGGSKGAPTKGGAKQPAAEQQTLGFRPEEIEPVELPPVNLMRTDQQSRHHDENGARAPAAR